MIPGGLADRDGRIQRGDRVLSVNGKVLKDATHAQALSYLKDDRPDVVLVVSRPLELEEDGKTGKSCRISMVKLYPTLEMNVTSVMFYVKQGLKYSRCFSVHRKI